MKAKVSAKTVKGLKPNPRGKGAAFVWDTQVSGFGVRCAPAGQKSFVVSYRFGTKKRIETLGPVEHGTPEEIDAARKRAYSTLARFSANPNMTVGQLWPVYLQDATPRWKATTEALNRNLYDRIISPHFAARQIEKVSAADVANWLQAHKDTPGQTNAALRLLKAMFHTAIRLDLTDKANPCAKVRPFKERQRQTFLDPAQYGLLWRAIEIEESLGGVKAVKRTGQGKGRGGRGMKEQESRGISRNAASLFRLLCLTGCRLREIMSARWEWIDLENRLLCLPDSKTGERRIPLPDAAIEELQTMLDRRTYGCPWLIEGAIPAKPMVNATKPWKRICTRAHRLMNEQREKDQLGPLETSVFLEMRIHDIRHSYASAAVGNGVPLAHVGKVLGHRQARTTERYSHLSDDLAAQTADKVSGFIVDATRKPAAKVVPVPKAEGED